MADMTDVADALAALITGAIYPNGVGAPSLTGVPVTIYQGWPNAATLDKDMKLPGRVHVSVWPLPTERVTESLTAESVDAVFLPATVLGTVSGNTVTLSGSITSGQNVALLIDQAPYTYCIGAGDTLASVAASLAGIISQGRTASSSGATVTIPGAKSISAREGGTGESLRLLERREKLFQISVWAPKPSIRDPLASAIDVALNDSSRLMMPDGIPAVLRYRSSVQHDDFQKTGIFRRDIMYAVEYCVTAVIPTTQIVIDQLNVQLPGVGQAFTYYS